jgi:hypothetical protein
MAVVVERPDLSMEVGVETGIEFLICLDPMAEMLIFEERLLGVEGMDVDVV